METRKSTRLRIIEILKSRSAATPNALARLLDVTGANARYHLRTLEREGIVTNIGHRPPKGRGRPSQIYGLAKKNDNLPKLSSILLEILLEDRSSEARISQLEKIGRRLVGEREEGPEHATQRLYQAISLLNKLNYQARWEAHADAPRVILGHCPYLEIIEEYPVLCEMDALILENLLGDNVLQTAKLARNEQGLPNCTFLVGKHLPSSNP